MQKPEKAHQNNNKVSTRTTNRYTHIFVSEMAALFFEKKMIEFYE